MYRYESFPILIWVVKQARLYQQLQQPATATKQCAMYKSVPAIVAGYYQAVRYVGTSMSRAIYIYIYK